MQATEMARMMKGLGPPGGTVPFSHIVASPERLLEMPVAELAQHLVEWWERNWAPLDRAIERDQYCRQAVGSYPHLGLQESEDCRNALLEAFQWLENQGFMAPGNRGGQSGSLLTKSGRDAHRSTVGLLGHVNAQMLPRDLHPALQGQGIWEKFARGQFDDAIKDSAIALEAYVKGRGNVGAGKIGVDAMRNAFGTKSGTLLDDTLPGGEQDGICNLFAGAMGWFRNRAAHGKQGGGSARDALSAVLFMDYLLRYAESRPAAP